MSATERQFNPSALSDEQLKVIAFAVAGQLREYFEGERPMNTEEAAKFLRVSRTTLHRMVTKGIVKGHTPEGFATFFFPSELVSAIKKH